MRSKKLTFLVFLLMSAIAAHSQIRQSLTVDLGVIRSFKSGQRYWAMGQTIIGQFNVNPKEGAVISFAFFGNGKFNNGHVADAKDPATIPNRILFTNDASLRSLQFSIGWKRYLIGSAYRQGFNAYLQLGLGILFNRITNTQSQAIDTAFYHTPVLAGRGRVNRLTVDPAVGVDYCLGGDYFLYLESRMYVPLSNYPSPYLADNQYTPLTATLNLGLRILF